MYSLSSWCTYKPTLPEDHSWHLHHENLKSQIFLPANTPSLIHCSNFLPLCLSVYSFKITLMKSYSKSFWPDEFWLLIFCFCLRPCNHTCVSMPFTTCGPRIGSTGRSRYFPCHWAAALDSGGMVPFSSIRCCHPDTARHRRTTWLPDQDERQQWCQLYALRRCHLLWVSHNLSGFCIIKFAVNMEHTQSMCCG